ncbi:MAG: VC0807 family protein [Opitutales bacterium]
MSEHDSQSPAHEQAPNPQASPKRENLWLNLGFNVVLPLLLLDRGTAWFGWDPSLNLIIALAFPTVYFIYDLRVRKKANFISILGFVSILLTGGIGLLELPPGWIAIKEAAIPLIIGVAVAISAFTSKPLARVFLLNPEIMRVDQVDRAAAENGREAELTVLLKRCTLLVAASFFLSTVLNYVLARAIVVSPAGTEAFNRELSLMGRWSWVVIMVPTMAVMAATMVLLFKGIRRITGLGLEDIVRDDNRKPAA